MVSIIIVVAIMLAFMLTAIIAERKSRKNEELSLWNTHNGLLKHNMLSAKRIESANYRQGLLIPTSGNNIQYINKTDSIYSSKYPYYALMSNNTKKLICRDTQVGQLVIKRFEREY